VEYTKLEDKDMKENIKFKELFYQEAFDGVPSTWVVQYYVGDNPFPEARYFPSKSEAEAFEVSISYIENYLQIN